MENKIQLRKMMLAKRESLNQGTLNAESNKIFEKLIELKQYKDAQIIFVYCDFRNEVKTDKIIQDILHSGKTLVMPRCKEKGIMNAFKVSKLQDLSVGMYGIKEPDNDCSMIVEQEIDLSIVPAICFDKKGNRIGYGAGYYDRFLPKTNSISVGLCFSEMLLDNLPCEEFDYKCDIVIDGKGDVYEK